MTTGLLGLKQLGTDQTRVEYSFKWIIKTKQNSMNIYHLEKLAVPFPSHVR